MQKTVLANTDELNTRAKILRAAKQAFLNKGFAHTNVRTIAAEAGVTTGAVYNLFKNQHTPTRASGHSAQRFALCVL